MDKFEEYIKVRYPVDYEHLKEKYPNVPVCDFYGDEKDLWQFRQSEIDNLQVELSRQSQGLHNVIDMEVAKNAKKDEQIEKLQAELSQINVQLMHAKQNVESFVKTNAKLELRFEKALSLIPSIRAENDLWGCAQVNSQIDLIETALQGKS